MIVFITNKNCGHCVAFRGKDGKPRNDKPWNNDYIRSLLMYPELNQRNIQNRISNGRPQRLQASVIVEINVATSGRNLDNVAEINIYSIIPSVEEINDFFKTHKGDFKFSDPPKIPGSAVERISIKRCQFNAIDIEVEVDGIYSPELSDFYTEEYFWKQVPAQIEILREYLFDGIKVPDELLDEINNKELTEFIKEKEAGINENINIFDDQIKSHFYGFPWLLKKICPIKLRDYEDYYPIWMLISPDEWKRSLALNSPLFARVTNNDTIWDGIKFSLVPYTRGEKIENLLEKYRNGDVGIHYNHETKKRPKFTWSSA